MSKVTMPEPDIFDGTRLDGSIASHGYSATALEAYAAAKAREALEAALAEAKRVSDKYGYGYYGSEVDAVDEVGEAIRALLPPTE